MKKFILLAFVFFVASPLAFSQTKAGKIDTTKHAEYYTCSMHPDVRSDTAGKCPKCGMKLNLTSKEQMKGNVMKNYNCPVHIDVISHDSTKCPKCGRKMNLSTKEQMKAETVKLYTCPMHPEVALNKNGECPKCGKTLVEKKNQ